MKISQIKIGSILYNVYISKSSNEYYIAFVYEYKERDNRGHIRRRVYYLHDDLSYHKQCTPNGYYDTKEEAKRVLATFRGEYIEEEIEFLKEDEFII